ncbi:hypothetical protein L218DRAFT_38820 [Marasmius fiardii PR-910]|nr:hypothetical protein L218DRAFT_38820 [Marasmius fiardii PR-910]
MLSGVIEKTGRTCTPENYMKSAPSFQAVQQQVSNIIRDKILVGHRLWFFLSILGLPHSALKTRDLALFLPLRRKLKSHTIVALKALIHAYMGRQVGMGYEDSLEDARACMDLFRSCEDMYEGMIAAGTWPCNLPPTVYAQYIT